MIDFERTFCEHIEYFQKRYGAENVETDVFDMGQGFAVTVSNGESGVRQFKKTFRLYAEQGMDVIIRANLQRCERFATIFLTK